MFDNLLTVRQYAELYSYNLNTVKTWVRERHLPTVCVAGRVFVAKSARPMHNVRAKTSWKGNL